MTTALLLCLLLPLAVGLDPLTADPDIPRSAPTFKHVKGLETDKKAMLGDRIRLRCPAEGNPQPAVAWFRNNTLINFSEYQERLQYKVRQMMLEIKILLTEDYGSWQCMAWNSEGKITRNFHIDIIDYCDAFLNPNVTKAVDLPMQCVCFWKYTKETVRTDINYTVATEDICLPFNYSIRYHARKPMEALPCFEPPCTTPEPSETTTTMTPSPSDAATTSTQPAHHQPPSDDSDSLEEEAPARLTNQTFPAADRMMADQPLPDADLQSLPTTDGEQTKQEKFTKLFDVAKMMGITKEEVAMQLQQETSSTLSPFDDPRFLNDSMAAIAQQYNEHASKQDDEDDEYDDEDDEDDEEFARKVDRRNRKPTLKVVAGAELVPARNKDDNSTEPHTLHFVGEKSLYKPLMTPAGRTIRLSCKHFGFPIPQLSWYRNDVLLNGVQVMRRATGGEYKMKGHTLEMVDVTESDSAIYRCQLFSSDQELHRRFNVTVTPRTRAAPKIIESSLKNQVAAIHDTVTFECEVWSDLLPHIVWVRVVLQKDNKTPVVVYNTTTQAYQFIYNTSAEMKNAEVISSGMKSSLKLHNVSRDDAGMYACIAGSSLGKNIANATLVVHDFVESYIETGREKSTEYGFWFWVVVAIALLLCGALISSVIVAGIIIRKNKALEEAKHKKLLIVARKHGEGERPKPDEDGWWAELPSNYHIQILEKDADGKIIHRRTRLSSDITDFTEVEVETDPDWEIERTRLVLGEKLGEGAFGEVWNAKLQEKDKPEREPEAVAVKRLKTNAHQKELIDLFGEAQMLKVIGDHRNILKLIGCCTGTGPLLVVLELCVHGNLRDFLRAHRPQQEEHSEYEKHPIDPEQELEYLKPKKVPKKVIPNINLRHLTQFAFQVAEGMKFMGKHKIIHRDLAARNVLVTSDLVMKISDFGLSRDVQSIDYYRKKGNGRLPIKWMALEALDSHRYTVESDVWSYGVLLWEIMTLGGTPYPTIAMPQLFSCLKDGYRMERPHNCPDEIYSIMGSCWMEDMSKRPSFDMIADFLEWMLAESLKHEIAIDAEHTITRSSGDFNDSSTSSGTDGGQKGGGGHNGRGPPGGGGEGGGGGGDHGNGDGDDKGGILKKDGSNIRPLSAPVLLPDEKAKHAICDDDTDTWQLDRCAEWLPPGMGYDGSRPLPPPPYPPPHKTVSSSEDIEKDPEASQILITRMRSPPPPPLQPIERSSSTDLESYLETTLLLPKAEGPDSAIGSPSATDHDGTSPFLGELGATVTLLDETLPSNPEAETRGYMNLPKSPRSPFYARGDATRFNFAPHVTLKYTQGDESVSIYPVNGRTNLGYMPSPLDSTSRYSMSSSGRGGSSANSSAEGLQGGILQYCQMEHRPRRPELKRQASSLDDTINDTSHF